jgi:hypothetical protein
VTAFASGQPTCLCERRAISGGQGPARSRSSATSAGLMVWASCRPGSMRCLLEAGDVVFGNRVRTLRVQHGVRALVAGIDGARLPIWVERGLGRDRPTRGMVSVGSDRSRGSPGTRLDPTHFWRSRMARRRLWAAQSRSLIRSVGIARGGPSRQLARAIGNNNSRAKSPASNGDGRP